MGHNLRLSTFRNLLETTERACRQGTSHRDRWIAFLIGCLGAAGHHRRRFRPWLLARLRACDNGGAVTLELIRPPMRRSVAVRLRTDNVSDYLVMDEVLKESRTVPSSPPSEIIDCGANIGAFSLWAGAVFPGVPIRCYEPESANFQWLKENLRLNGCGPAEVFQQGVWSQETTLYFQAAESYSGRVTTDRAGTPVACTLPVIGAGSWLKLDIEGAEYEVIPALLARGDRPAFISMEIHGAPVSGRSLVSLLEKHGYTVSGNLDPSFDCWEVSATFTAQSHG